MAAVDNRQHGGNTGYDDQADAYYSWDSTVNNYGQIQVGDTVAIWDKRKLLGVSVVEEIDVTPAEKCSCVVPIQPVDEWESKHASLIPKYRCRDCQLEFDEPHVEVQTVQEYQSERNKNMSETPFSKQCEILGNFAISYGDDDTLDAGWQNFIRTHDVGLPLCSLIWLGLAQPTPERGEKYITDTWNSFCSLLGIAPDKRYADLKDVFDASWANDDE